MSLLSEIRGRVKRCYQSLPIVRELAGIRRTLEHADEQLLRLDLIHYQMLRQLPKYQDPKRLALHEMRGFSQNGEDGIIAEIFKRVGETSRLFVEIGVGDGLENNTAMLLWLGWKGFWFEGGPENIESIGKRFAGALSSGRLKLSSGFVTAENVEGLLKSAGIPTEFDLLSIDIDRNTYWVLERLASYRPRVMAVEYNASVPPGAPWQAEYRADLMWNGTMYFGASLKSFELLGRRLGYSLVGCDLTGTNAFFVRNDLCGDKFSQPCDSENHYEPPRYSLLRRAGHPPSFRDF